MIGNKEPKWIEGFLLMMVVCSFGMPWFERLIWYAGVSNRPLDSQLTGYESMAYLGLNDSFAAGVFWAFVLLNVCVLLFESPRWVIPAKMMLVGWTLYTAVQTLLAHQVFGNLTEIHGGFFLHLGMGLVYVVIRPVRN